MFLQNLSDIGADVLDLSGSTLELGDKLKLEPVSSFYPKIVYIIIAQNISREMYLLINKIKPL